MKKLITIFAIILVSVAVFAFDLNIGVDPMHNFDATATVSMKLDRIEVGGGVYSNALANVLAFASDKSNDAKLKDKVFAAFKNAEYGVLGQVYVDVLDSNVKLAAGGIVDIGSVSNLNETIAKKDFNMNILASARATYLLRDTLGVFGQFGLPVATFTSNADGKQFGNLLKGAGDGIGQYVKDNARFQFGVVLSI